MKFVYYQKGLTIFCQAFLLLDYPNKTPEQIHIFTSPYLNICTYDS